VPFALHDILILVFGNHGKMNRGLLQWRVPAATSVDQETTTDLRRGAGTRGTRCEFRNGSASCANWTRKGAPSILKAAGVRRTIPEIDFSGSFVKS